MKWLHALAAFLTLLLLVTRSRCLVTNYTSRKPYSLPSCKSRATPGGGGGGARACRRAGLPRRPHDDARIKKDPAIIVEDKHLADYECD